MPQLRRGVEYMTAHWEFTYGQERVKQAPIPLLAQNVRTAGATAPLKWEVRNLQGQPLTSPTLIQSLTSQRVDCDDPSITIGSPANELNLARLTTPGGQFLYNWMTKKSYLHTCRMLTLKLTDGVPHRALCFFVE